MRRKNVDLDKFRSVPLSASASRRSESDFLSVFSLQSPGQIGNENHEYRLEARLTSLAASWRSLGIPQPAQAGKSDTVPLLATAIIQALAVTETT
jgi:hypothetical protein